MTEDRIKLAMICYDVLRAVELEGAELTVTRTENAEMIVRVLRTPYSNRYYKVRISEMR